MFFSFLFSASFDAVGILLKAIALFKLPMNEHKTQMIKTRKTSGCNDDCYLLEVMLSKFKVEPVDGGNFVTHFRHNRAQSCAPAQIQPSLTEV